MMDTFSPELAVPEDIIKPILNFANSSTLNVALESLIAAAKTQDGRSDLASKDILPIVLELAKSLSNPSTHQLLLLSLKLLRNLCAGEILNQNSFVKERGPETVIFALSSVCSDLNSDLYYGIVRMGLQLLGNVSLAGEEHQRAIWARFFPNKLMELVRIRRLEISDPLCMIIYTCCSGCNERLQEFCGVQGLTIVAEIIRTASTAALGEDWMELLLSRICFEEPYFIPLFHQLSSDGVAVNGDDFESKDIIFTGVHAFLLHVLSESLNKQMGEITISHDFELCVLGVLKRAIGAIDSSRSSSGIPTGIPTIDVLGYSVCILRDIRSQDDWKSPGSKVMVDSILSSGLLNLLLDILRNLGPPGRVKKSISQGENQEGGAPNLLKVCPYKGFRRDIVAVIGNCLYLSKPAQDEVRRQNGILLLLQQCVSDEDNPFLREWGIWTVRSLLQGNEENQREVAELEFQGPADVLELNEVGLKVEVDQETRRAKLVSVPQRK